MAIIGIDLGTSNSAAAVLRGGRPVIIPSTEGVSLGGKARLGGGRRGDLNVRIGVRVPESPSSEERELYERLRRLRATPGRRRPA